MGSVWEPGSGWAHRRLSEETSFWEKSVPGRKHDIEGQGTLKCPGCRSIGLEVAHDQRGHQGWIKGIDSLGEICVILGAGTPVRGSIYGNDMTRITLLI